MSEPTRWRRFLVRRRLDNQAFAAYWDYHEATLQSDYSGRVALIVVGAVIAVVGWEVSPWSLLGAAFAVFVFGVGYGKLRQLQRQLEHMRVLDFEPPANLREMAKQTRDDRRRGTIQETATGTVIQHIPPEKAYHYCEPGIVEWIANRHIVVIRETRYTRPWWRFMASRKAWYVLTREPPNQQHVTLDIENAERSPWYLEREN